MKEIYYLISGNIDPSKDTDKIHSDIINSSNKDRPYILLFATASSGLNWHEGYVSNISNIFNRYNCDFKIIDNHEDTSIPDEISKSDIIYFLGGSPFKHTQLTKYKELFKKVPIKVGTSAGAIYLGYHTFFFQKEDYVVAVPNMLNFVDIHVLPHSEVHNEPIVFNYLVNEIRVSTLKLYNQSGLKITKSEQGEEVFSILGNTPNEVEKVELIMKNNQYISSTDDKTVNLTIRIVND